MSFYSSAPASAAAAAPSYAAFLPSASEAATTVASTLTSVHLSRFVDEADDAPAPTRRGGAHAAGTQAAGASTSLPPLSPAEWADHLKKLKEVVLSPACCTEGKSSGSYLPLAMTPAEVGNLFRASIPDVDSKMDRLGADPVLKFINSTLAGGLPALQGDPPLFEHVRKALQTILAMVSQPAHPPASRCKILGRLVEAYQACQIIQAQVIDAVYGMLVGRDATLRDQLLALVDVHKQTALDNVTIAFFPSINTGVEGPHVQNRLLLDIGARLGLRGISRARLDRLVSPTALAPPQRDMVVGRFVTLFDIEAVVEEFMDNINAQDGMPRHVSQDTLEAWATENTARFPAHCIYYDDDHPERYTSQPKDALKPFLTREVALLVMELCLTG